MDAVAVRDLAFQFGRTSILESLTFRVRAGEFCCLLGPTGCGKSTLLRILGGLLDGHRGEVRVAGKPPADAWAHIAYVFQTPRLLSGQTALQNAMLGMRLRRDGREVEAMHGAAVRYLAMVGLAADAHKPGGVLSIGERQRVALARALAVEPEILLMDEPFSGLDVETRGRLQRELLEIWERTGKTVLFVTHDLDEALALGDRIIVLSAKPARILADLPVPVPRPRAVEGSTELQALKARLRTLFQAGAA